MNPKHCGNYFPIVQSCRCSIMYEPWSDCMALSHPDFLWLSHRKGPMRLNLHIYILLFKNCYNYMGSCLSPDSPHDFTVRNTLWLYGLCLSPNVKLWHGKSNCHSYHYSICPSGLPIFLFCASDSLLLHFQSNLSPTFYSKFNLLLRHRISASESKETF